MSSSGFTNARVHIAYRLLDIIITPLRKPTLGALSPPVAVDNVRIDHY
jgi:hypothetical protein